MQNVHDLHSQDNHKTPPRFAFGVYDTKLQILAAIDHVLQHVIDSVLVNSGAFGNNLTHFAAHAANKAGGAGFETCTADRLRKCDANRDRKPPANQSRNVRACGDSVRAE